MKNTKKIFAVMTSLMLLSGAVACGEKSEDGGNKPAATDIVVYAGGSSEFSWVKGSKEEEVIDYIEQKYYEDTQISLNFKVNTEMGKDMKNSIATDVRDGKVDVVISHTSGGDGIDDWMFNNSAYADLRRYVSNYKMDKSGVFEWSDGTNTYNALTRMKTGTEYIGIPSVINPYKFGILVRKDWMEAAGYTDDATDTTKTYVGDFETFTEMALAVKTQQKLDYAVTGAIFDVEKAGLLGACGVDAGYYSNTVYSENGTNYVGPGNINPDYAEVLEIEYEWMTQGVLAPDCDNILLTQGENNFIAGKSAVFLQDPSVEHLIEVARRAKAANPEAEFTVLGALTKDKNSTEKGFMRNSVASFAACITKNSKNVKTIMAFLNWMYSSEENYLLCKYGRAGIDWIYDRENGTYGYATEADYVNPPYSGILSFVDNQNMADLTYAGYTEEEKSWIATARDKNNYVDNDTVDYLLLISNTELSTAAGNAAINISTTIRPIWNGKTTVDKFETARLGYMTTAKAYMQEMYSTYAALSGKA